MPSTAGGCEPSYPERCIPVGAADLDCPDIEARRFAGSQPDPQRFGGDGDGVPGRDRIAGGSGRDTITGGADGDLIYGDYWRAIVENIPGLGGDILYGSSGPDQLNGGEDGDWIYGYGGNDLLYGGTGDDRLYGFEGADGFAGEAGLLDTCSGDGGSTVETTDYLIEPHGCETIVGVP